MKFKWTFSNVLYFVGCLFENQLYTYKKNKLIVAFKNIKIKKKFRSFLELTKHFATRAERQPCNICNNVKFENIFFLIDKKNYRTIIIQKMVRFACIIELILR